MYIKEVALADSKADSRILSLKNETDKLLKLLLTIYDQKGLASRLNSKETGLDLKEISREKLNKWKKNPDASDILIHEDTNARIRKALLPKKPAHWDNPDFKFIDLFAGIGGLRKGFEDVGGKCVFTSEYDDQARRTYLANHYVGESELAYFTDTEEENPEKNVSLMDITKLTLTGSEYSGISESERLENIKKHIPEHDVLLAGFPCQPFSIAGVSKKNSLGRSHGFECTTQGTLFFDVEKIIQARKPNFFVLENVKNLKSHDKGNTFATIIKTLDSLGYFIANISDQGETIEEAIAVVRSRKNEPTIVDGAKFTPQHRERVVLVGIRNDLLESNPEFRNFSLTNLSGFYPEKRLAVSEILCDLSDEQLATYTLTENLWNYLYHYALKHKSKGNGFGFGLVNPDDPDAITRTLSARYYKDGSEILINHRALGADYLEKNKAAAAAKNADREAYTTSKAAESIDPKAFLDEAEYEAEFKKLVKSFEKEYDEEYGRYSSEFDPAYKTPRRLSPKECARLMGFEKPVDYRNKDLDSDFVQVCADNRAYKQFGNSVVVPVFRAVAKLMKSELIDPITKNLSSSKKGGRQ
ncbi:DNA (cytosine-5-)-methyltransferase [Alteromonas confluentis]|uniref:Cytosine-specific methyltransferase n=1 Tax=Alteromonas confluentis TaxID=1656094 RepID=A0A1E7Z8K6_9ALTE|nr:DNA (cytosine-5-)-methyltransferase [Alteromonas confluentis]OFC69856.1 DNA (cytosine-5-)-methyltransferase [Alteromonas confluentis]